MELRHYFHNWVESGLIIPAEIIDLPHSESMLLRLRKAIRNLIIKKNIKSHRKSYQQLSSALNFIG